MTAAPLRFLLLLFAGWTHRRQLEAIEYLKEENRVLGEQLGDRRLRFTDAQRRRLAAKEGRSTRARSTRGSRDAGHDSCAGTASSSGRSTTARPDAASVVR
jgi:hypothetical protein